MFRKRKVYGVYNVEVVSASSINIVFTRCRCTFESFTTQSQPERKREVEL